MRRLVLYDLVVVLKNLKACIGGYLVNNKTVLVLAEQC